MIRFFWYLLILLGFRTSVYAASSPPYVVKQISCTEEAGEFTIQLRYASESQKTPCGAIVVRNSSTPPRHFPDRLIFDTVEACEARYQQQVVRLLEDGLTCRSTINKERGSKTKRKAHLKAPPAVEKTEDIPAAGPPTDPSPSTLATLEENKSWEQNYIGEAWLYGGLLQTLNSDVNPGNRFLETPYLDSTLDLRGEAKFFTNDSKILIRPRLTANEQSAKLQSPSEQKNTTKLKLDLTDFYGQTSFGESLQLTGGLFVDGWGPAEFVSPTNPFIHLRLENKDFYYQEKGHALLKALWNPTAKSSLILMAEPVSNNVQSFRAKTAFEPKWSLRSEIQSDDAAEIASLSFGQEEDRANYFGEYFQLKTESSGISGYFEARHTSSPKRYDFTEGIPFNSYELKSKEGLQTYSVTGLRWEGSVDIRVEWIYYQLGYSENEWGKVKSLVTQPSPLLGENAEIFFRNGLEFSTKNWWSVSVRKPNFGPNSNWQWVNRLLVATGDSAFGSARSGLVQSDLEMPIHEAWTAFAEGQYRFGDADTELLLDKNVSIFFGARRAW